MFQFLLKRVQKFGKCKDYIISREITTLLKIAVDNVILELCDSCDYLANLLHVKKNNEI